MTVNVGSEEWKLHCRKGPAGSQAAKKLGTFRSRKVARPLPAGEEFGAGAFHDICMGAEDYDSTLNPTLVASGEQAYVFGL